MRKKLASLLSGVVRWAGRFGWIVLVTLYAMIVGWGFAQFSPDAPILI